MSENCFFSNIKSANFSFYQKQNPTYVYDGKALKIKTFLQIGISEKQQKSDNSKTIGKSVFDEEAPRIPLPGSKQRSPACQKRYEHDSVKRMTALLWNAGAIEDNTGLDFGVLRVL